MWTFWLTDKRSQTERNREKDRGREREREMGGGCDVMRSC